MKSAVALASVALLLSFCVASPLGDNNLPPNDVEPTQPHYGYEYVNEHRDNNRYNLKEYSCHEQQENGPWGPSIPQDLQQNAKNVDWKYNKYLANITKQYRQLLQNTGTNEITAPVNGLPAPEDTTLAEIPLPNGPFSKMINAQTENLHTLRYKNLVINYNAGSALLSMTSPKMIHIRGEKINKLSGSPNRHCNLTLKEEVPFKVRMNLKKNNQGQYDVTLNECKFGDMTYGDINQICGPHGYGSELGKSVSNNEPEANEALYNGMAQLVCEQAYFAQIKNDVEEQIRLWHPVSRPRTYVNTEMYKLMRAYSREKLQNTNIEVGQNCSFKKNGFVVQFEKIRINNEQNEQFNPIVPVTYTTDSEHHIDAMVIAYQPLTAEFRIKFKSGYGDHTVEQQVQIIAPVKINMHFTAAASNAGESFSLRYYPGVMVAGTHVVQPSSNNEECSIRETIIALNRKYMPTIVDALTNYVQNTLFEFLYPGALRGQQPRMSRVHGSSSLNEYDNTYISEFDNMYSH